MRLTHITKSFGGIRAVDDVSLEVAPGEIVGLVGENGAGKTTLMRIAASEVPADTGVVATEGHIELVHQHFLLVPEFTIAENLALSDDRLFRIAGRRKLEQEATLGIAESGITLTGVSRRVVDLSVGEKSKLELAKAITRRPSTLILDEPTSVLTPYESEELFQIMRRLAEEGSGVVFISHKLPEVLSIADRVVVMREGRVVMETATSTANPHSLADSMIGASATPIPSAPRRSFVNADDLDTSPIELEDVTGKLLQGVTLRVNRSEIVAIVGVAGNGQRELAEILAGLAKPGSGRISIHRERSGQIPEDRTRDGIVGQMTIAENLALRSKRWNPYTARQRAASLIDLYSIRAHNPLQYAGELSGGNQQKLILARELEGNPEAIIAAEPTRGLDVQATRFVHERIRAAAADGAAVLLITSDLDEAFLLADALHVIYRGRISERMTPQEASERVAPLMAGLG